MVLDVDPRYSTLDLHCTCTVAQFAQDDESPPPQLSPMWSDHYELMLSKLSLAVSIFNMSILYLKHVLFEILLLLLVISEPLEYELTKVRKVDETFPEIQSSSLLL